MKRISGNRRRAWVSVFAVLALILSACGSDEETSSGQSEADKPTVVVTTNILGDVVTNLVGDQLDVVTIMPVGADPHDFQPSAQQVAQVTDADALITNGASFEEGLLDVIESAGNDGVPVFGAIDAVDTIEFSSDEDGHDEHKDEDDEHEGEEAHEDEEGHDEHEGEEAHEDEEGHDEHDHADGVDPHFFTDPARMAVAAEGIIDFLATNVSDIDADALRSDAAAYIDQLRALDAEVAEILAVVPDDGRALVTNHEVFGYFADRYDFDVIGTVIPSPSTADSASAQSLANLAETVEVAGVAAIFGDTSSSDELIGTLADEVGEIQIVELFSESLGDADSEGPTYVTMVRINAQRIAAALAA